MKPKEFDELIRQKFDQNDFPYESRNWDKLADQMDGRTKKRSVMIWWMMPLASIAASVAMAIGVTFFFQQSQKGLRPANTASTQRNNIKSPVTIEAAPENAIVATAPQYQSVTVPIAIGSQADLRITKAKNNITTSAAKKSVAEKFAISFENAVGFPAPARSKPFIFNPGSYREQVATKDKKIVEQNEGFSTFKPEDQEYKKPTKNSITIAGGVNHGNENTGYMLGANLRHMINDRLFIESDVAFANSSNSQTTQVLVPTAGSSGARQAAGRSTAASSRPLNTESPVENVENENQSYTLYYAQVTPGLGYKVMNNLSLGVGPDFQQMLVDNRPAPSAVDRNNVAVAPMFDVGFVGKTEYALTKKVKAGVSYRKGINNLLTPMDKYIDRDYLQFQLKCTVFNK